jgi:hypothetical protein
MLYHIVKNGKSWFGLFLSEAEANEFIRNIHPNDIMPGDVFEVRPWSTQIPFWDVLKNGVAIETRFELEEDALKWLHKNFPCLERWGENLYVDGINKGIYQIAQQKGGR